MPAGGGAVSGKWRKIEAEPADEFDSGRLWGNEKYNLCNMLVRQEAFPRYIYEGEATGTGDAHYEIWSDRVHEAWSQAVEAADPEESARGGGAEDFFRRLSRESFFRFLGKLIEATRGEPRHPVTGGRIVRYTNVSSGYPCYRVGIFCKSPETPSCSAAAPITRRPRANWGINPPHYTRSYP